MAIETRPDVPANEDRELFEEACNALYDSVEYGEPMQPGLTDSTMDMEYVYLRNSDNVLGVYSIKERRILDEDEYEVDEDDNETVTIL